MKKERMTMSDEQRERMLIEEQIERAAVEAGPSGSKLEESPPAEDVGLKRDEATEKIVYLFLFVPFWSTRSCWSPRLCSQAGTSFCIRRRKKLTSSRPIVTTHTVPRLCKNAMPLRHVICDELKCMIGRIASAGPIQ